MASDDGQAGGRGEGLAALLDGAALLPQLSTGPRNVIFSRRCRGATLEQNESTPATGALPNCIRSGRQAASLFGWTSRTLLKFVIGIVRDFIASGISRKRSTCRSPFSRFAPLTLT